MIKKMLLLASMALAVIAFAAPAAAQAEAYWTHTGGTVGFGEGNGTLVETEHNITSSAAGLNTTANIFLTGEVWNDAESEMGEGVITRAEATGHGVVVGVPTALCTVEVVLGNIPWDLTLTTDPEAGATTHDATLDVEGVTFRNNYSHGCQTLGIPAVTAATGTVTATAHADTATGDVELTLEKKQHVTAYNPGTGQHITPSPEIELTSEGTPLTLHAEDGDIGVEQH